jgi:benzaldehyde dehydrogenase (NAD)
VLDDADLEAAVNGSGVRRLRQLGPDLHDAPSARRRRQGRRGVRQQARGARGGLPLGDPRKGPVVLGSVVDRSTVERCNALIDDAVAKGAIVVCGGKADSNPDGGDAARTTSPTRCASTTRKASGP